MAADDLYRQSSPQQFWRVLIDPAPAEEEWAAAIRQAASALPTEARARGDEARHLLAMTLGEGRFGLDHWKSNAAQRFYYSVKPAIPQRFTRGLRRVYARRRSFSLHLRWPVEPRYVWFEFQTIAELLRLIGRDRLPFLNFWPGRHRYALVLTHDVESAEGQRFVPAVAELEAGLGFRSSFNFVPERYRLDRGLMQDLRQRGFEVGVHGLRHDGKLFFDRTAFEHDAAQINSFLADFEAVGFRAPLTQRNPEWMQLLNVEYDSSFFDTDPFEPIAGGSMSVWPFQMGHFIELPYTLVQDHTLAYVLGETTPRLWLDKVDFLRASHGMALLITHPDYLQHSRVWNLYRNFLIAMRERSDFFHALPMQTARWWRARAEARTLNDLRDGTVAEVGENGVDDHALPAIHAETTGRVA